MGKEQRKETLFSMLARQARRLGNRTAVCDSEQALSYEELEQAALRLAGGLHRAGVRKGDSVFVQMANSVDMAVTLFACFRLGVVCVLLLPAYRTGDMLPLSTRIRPTCFIGEGRLLGFDYGKLADEVAAQSPSIKTVVRRTADVPEGVFSWQELAGSEPLDESVPGPSPDDVAAVILSGGTTGFPKPIPRTHANLLDLSGACLERSGLDESLVYLVDLPLGHIFILAVPGFIGSLQAGGKTVFSLTASTDEVFPLIEEEGATYLTLVPPMLPIWLDALSFDDSDLSSLRNIEVGGAPLKGGPLFAVAAALGCTFQQAYGFSEGLVTLTDPLGQSEAGDMSVQGLPVMADDEIRIIRADGSDAGQGEKGELLFRGPNLSGHYFHCPDLDGAFDAEGFFHSGDQACWVGAGRFSICGRLKELINRNGEKFSPLEVEEIVRKHPSVEECVVVGVPNSTGSDSVCCWLRNTDGDAGLPSLTELRAFLLKEGLASYKLPERLCFTDEWPKTAFGKILKSRLVAMSQTDAADRLTK